LRYWSFALWSPQFGGKNGAAAAVTAAGALFPVKNGRTKENKFYNKHRVNLRGAYNFSKITDFYNYIE